MGLQKPKNAWILGGCLLLVLASVVLILPHSSQAATYGSSTYGGGGYNQGNNPTVSTPSSGGGEEVIILPTPRIVSPVQKVRANQKVQIKAKVEPQVTRVLIKIGRLQYSLYDDGKHADRKKHDNVYATKVFKFKKTTIYTIISVYPDGQSTAKGAVIVQPSSSINTILKQLGIKIQTVVKNVVNAVKFKIH